MVSKNGDKPSAKSVTSLIQKKHCDQHMLIACCIPIWANNRTYVQRKYSNIAVNPTGYITSKTKINANNPKMNDSITPASELHKDHNFYDYVTFNFISFETEALNGWKNIHFITQYSSII